MTHFLAMGGYAQYVWPAYGVALTVLGLNVWWSFRLVTRSRKRVYES